MVNKDGNELDVFPKLKEKKLTAANSHYVNEVAFYIVKKNAKGKAMPFFCSYLFPSGISVGFHSDKNILKKMLDDRVEETKTFMREYEVEGI
ncbi:MAG: hypothetical protein DRQ78_10010 [Epsilonproteobacteria bacterium]|nr:MAG: hypothetical protein DRQ78_10010 [Campylobacterota bacterium]